MYYVYVYVYIHTHTYTLKWMPSAIWVLEMQANGEPESIQALLSFLTLFGTQSRSRKALPQFLLLQLFNIDFIATTSFLKTGLYKLQQCNSGLRDTRFLSSFFFPSYLYASILS